ncbi:hypothetical protein AUR67_17380 [Pseudoalteromonas sp. XI10]|uniref:hypothetical protein n=1 Tax=Pseudoalteromonas sp. XI10 TaxID=1766621 RepID=UPI000733562B|nr:hypothetical protein [Pseudoalteromonas sp. XI10]KTG18926.1 hypothetical protein AUR67_17380 [Pseudoalteromonas sp. XI10]
MTVWANRNTLLHLLEYADFDPDVQRKSGRRDAYITELYFEKVVLPKIANQSTLGWCCTRYEWCNIKKIHLSRHWFKVIPDFLSWDQKELDKKFISLMRKKGSSQRFFFILPLETSESFFVIRECVKVEGEYKLKKWNEKEGEPLSLRKMNSEVDRLLNLQFEGSASFAPKWLGNLDIPRLKSLLAQRVLMNKGLKFPVDIDAIEIKNDLLIFHEFKRKDPCRGRVRKAHSPVNSRFLNHAEYEIKNNRLDNSKLEIAHDTRFYGLDKSHIGNLEYCFENQIDYVYTIWDSSEISKYPRLDELFTPNDGPKKQPKIVSRKLSLSDFNHFTYTEGNESGQFTNALRVQGALEASLFNVCSN